MDGSERISSVYLKLGFHKPQFPPGFNPQSNPNLPPHSHSSMKLTPSTGSSFRLDHNPPPPPSFPHRFNSNAARIPDPKTVPKKKRGRPRKNPAPAVRTPDQTTPTPQPKRVHDQPDQERKRDIQEQERRPDLSKLTPPSRSNGFKTGDELAKLLKSASAVLITGIKEAADANEMIDLSSKAFTYFDSIGIDYTPVYKAVCSVIRHHCDKEALARQKPQAAFETKKLHDQAVFELSRAKERYTRVNQELEDAQCDFDSITAYITRLSEQINKGKEKQANLEAKVAAALAEKVSCDEAYHKAKEKMEKVGPEMSDAQKAIDEYERRCKETVDGLRRAMEETSSLGI